MNKKLLSLVLAAVFTVSLGVGTTLAYVDVGEAGAGISTGSSGVVMKVSNSSLSDFIEQEKGHMVTMFGYAAGSLTYIVNQNNITFYDSNGAKAGFSVAKGADGNLKYTLTSLTLSSRDTAEINACQDEYNAALKNATGNDKKNLESMGLLGYYLTVKCKVDPAALKTAKTAWFDENGNKLTDSQAKNTENKTIRFIDENGNAVDKPEKAATEWASWLTKGVDGGANVTDWLNKGINFSVTLGLGGSEATVTYSQNGKQQSVLSTIAGDSYVQTKYKYNEKGFLEYTDTIGLKASVNGNGMDYTLQKTRTVMDEFGRQSYAIEIDDNGNEIGYTKQKLDQDALKENRIEYKDIEGDEGKATGHTIDYHYSANGSIASYTDNKTGNTTHYAAGMAAYVTNDKGETVQKYTYKNGITQMVQSFNDGTAVNTTVFDSFGRQLGTVNGGVTYNVAVNAINDVLTGRTNLNDSATSAACIVQSVKVYKDYLENGSNFATFINSNTDISYSFAQKTYGYANTVGEIQISTGDNGTVEVDTTTENERTETTALKGKYTLSNGEKITINEDGDLASLSYEDAVALCKAAGIDESNIRAYNNTSDGKKYYRAATKDDAKVYIYCNNTDAAKKVFKALGLTVSSGFNMTTNHDNVWTYLLGSKITANVTDNMKTTATAKLTTTYSIQGISLGQKDSYMGINKTKTGETQIVDSGNIMDPAVAGTFLGTTVIDGKTYAMVGDASINVLDGGDFRAAEGEVMYVDITGKENVVAGTKAGEEVMFTGDVAQGVDGHFTITMNTNYGGGFVSGEVAVEAMKTEITQTAQTVSMARDALELGEITQAEYDSIVQNSGWIGTNTAENLDKFAKGNFSWDDENKSFYENLKDAYGALGVAINF